MAILDEINELVGERSDRVELANKINKFRKYKGYTQQIFLEFLLNQDPTLKISIRTIRDICSPNREQIVNGRKHLPPLDPHILSRIAEIINQHELATANLEGKQRPTFKKIEHDVKDDHTIKISIKEHNERTRLIGNLRHELMKVRTQAIDFAFHTVEESQNTALKKKARLFLKDFMIIDREDFE